jgi:exonuclease VII large subunit
MSSTTIGLKTLYERLTANLKVFNDQYYGLVISELSINDKIEPNSKFPNSYFTATTKIGKQSWSAKIIISNSIVRKAIEENPAIKTGATFDIKINKIEIGKFGTLNITALEIKESGVSSREIRVRRLEAYCKDRGYKSLNRSLPSVVASVKAITSGSSSIESDVVNQIGLKRVEVVKCASSSDIAREIDNTREFDIIVLFRGGREDEAMAIFSDEVVVEAIMRSPIAVYTALGHEGDMPFIARLSDGNYPTPTSFAKSIREHNQNMQDNLIMIDSFLKEKKKSGLVEVGKYINSLMQEISIQKRNMIVQESKMHQNIYDNIKSVGMGAIRGVKEYIATLGSISPYPTLLEVKNYICGIEDNISEKLNWNISYVKRELAENDSKRDVMLQNSVDSKILYIDNMMHKIETISSESSKFAESKVDDDRMIKMMKLVILALVLALVGAVFFYFKK